MVEGTNPVLEYLTEALDNGETVLQHVGVRRRSGLLVDIMGLLGTLIRGSSRQGDYYHTRVQDYLALTDRRLLLFTVDRVMRPHLIEVVELSLSEIQGLELRRNLITFWSWTLKIAMASRAVKLIYYWPQNGKAKRLLRELSSRMGILVKGLGYG